MPEYDTGAEFAGRYDPDSECEGRYPIATIKSAGEVSPVFERKARKLFEEHLGELSENQWYRTEDVVNAYHSLVNQVGDKSMREGGKESAKAVQWPENVDSPMDGLAALAEMHKQAYRNSDQEYPAGRYTFEKINQTTAHVGITEDYPLPSSNAKGVFIGVVQSLSGTTPNVAEITPKDNERKGFEIKWG